MKRLKLELILILVFTVLIISCSKHDKTTGSAKIKLLTETKLELGESNVILDGSENIINRFETVNYDNFIYFILDDSSVEEWQNWIKFAVIIVDEEKTISEISISATLNHKSYTGTKFTTENRSETAIRLTGVLVANDKTNQDINIIVNFDKTSIGLGSSTIMVDGNIAKLNGDLGTLAYNQILDLNSNYPNVNTILFENVPGSVNDDVNVKTGRLIRKAGYTTWVKSNSDIASGGVDLFCAGKKELLKMVLY
jgi:hypothetical protein